MDILLSAYCFLHIAAICLLSALFRNLNDLLRPRDACPRGPSRRKYNCQTPLSAPRNFRMWAYAHADCPCLGWHSLGLRCFGGSFFCLFPLAGVDFTLFWFVVFCCLFLLCSLGPFVWCYVFQYFQAFSLLGVLLFFSSRLALQRGKHVLRYVSNWRTLLSIDVFQ